MLCFRSTALALAATAAFGLTLPAQAAWTEMGGNEQVTFYADFDAIEKTAEGLALWTLVDAKKPRQYEGKTFQSVRSQFELQCAGPKIRERETRFHAGLQGGGETVAGYKVDEPAWEAVSPDTVKDALAKRACQQGAAKR